MTDPDFPGGPDPRPVPFPPNPHLDALTATLRDGVNDYCRRVLILLGTHARTPRRGRQRA
jgi:hypothetical protein